MPEHSAKLHPGFRTGARDLVRPYARIDQQFYTCNRDMWLCFIIIIRMNKNILVHFSLGSEASIHALASVSV